MYKCDKRLKCNINFSNSNKHTTTLGLYCQRTTTGELIELAKLIKNGIMFIFYNIPVTADSVRDLIGNMKASIYITINRRDRVIGYH